uniref:Uncharacterized protein n=1 Tax=Heterorhabditis bacteriophora TaxID=37862 RepID=A0A1I7WZ35_HETBA
MIIKKFLTNLLYPFMHLMPSTSSIFLIILTLYSVSLGCFYIST